MGAMMTCSLNCVSNLSKHRRTGYAWLAAIAVFAGLIQVSPARAATGFTLDDYAGKVVLIDFWASWCGPCRQSFPWMNTMQSKYSNEGLVIVAVNVDNDLAAANRFLADFPAKFQIHFDEDKSLARDYEVFAMPSSFLIGRDGQVVQKHMGFKVLKQDEYEAAIRAALDLET
jgi:thiol-disulfide isomerase/thioredoxin